MEYLVIALFSLVLLFTMLFDVHLLYALTIGYILFFSYALRKGCNAKELLLLSFEHTKTIGNILILFSLIGILTATWRTSGSIAYLVVNASSILIPSLFLVSTFLLCVFISVLTGTSFGTSASIGVICMTMGNILNIDPAYLGGAILSGSYFGDRMSPMSSSAHLVAKITMTDIFTNIKNMFRSCIIPTILTCILYIFLGYENSESTIPYDTLNLFRENFNLTWETIIPVVLVVLLALFRVNTRIVMFSSVVTASIISVFIQNTPPLDLLKFYWFGFQSSNAELNNILAGGGLSSMFTVCCIVAVSSSYMGLFKASNFFDGMHKHIASLSTKVTPFGSTMIVGLLTCMMTCNQTLSIFLTKSLCEKQYSKNENLAHAIENTAILMCAFIPWNIACTLTLANIGAPITSIFYAFFLYLVPIISFFYFRKKEL